MGRIEQDTYFLALAAVAATRSTCLRRAVGCVLVDAQRRVLATGYNDVAAGMPHCNEAVRCYDEQDDVVTWRYPNACEGAACHSGSNLDACEALHAEQNAIARCRSIDAVDTAYVTTAPCVTCTKQLLGTSCRRIVCGGGYAASGEELWHRAGREWWPYDGGVERAVRCVMRHLEKRGLS